MKVYTVKWADENDDGTYTAEKTATFGSKSDAVSHIENMGGTDQGDGEFFMGESRDNVAAVLDPTFPKTSKLVARISTVEVA